MKRVLIVDDEPVILDVLQRILSRLGFDTAVADLGSSALKIFSRGMFDLVLMDILLPGNSGFEIAREMKQTRPGQKIVMITAIDKYRAITQSNDEGVNGVLPKPFTFEMVKSVVEGVLNGEDVFQQEGMNYYNW